MTNESIMIYSTQVNVYRGHFEWQESICQKKKQQQQQQTHTHN